MAADRGGALRISWSSTPRDGIANFNRRAQPLQPVVISPIVEREEIRCYDVWVKRDFGSTARNHSRPVGIKIDEVRGEIRSNYSHRWSRYTTNLVGTNNMRRAFGSQCEYSTAQTSRSADLEKSFNSLTQPDGWSIFI
jgi:hypothetical protein